MSDLRTQIIEAKEEKLSLQHSLEMIVSMPRNFQPSVANVEVWEKYGARCPDPQTKELFIRRSWKRLDWQDWVRFYTWLIDWRAWVIEKLELELEKQNYTHGKGGPGVHQDNREWVSQKWHEVRKELPSNNQADEKIQELYKDEFNGMSISKSQIQRYTGRQ